MKSLKAQILQEFPGSSGILRFVFQPLESEIPPLNFVNTEFSKTHPIPVEKKPSKNLHPSLPTLTKLISFLCV